MAENAKMTTMELKVDLQCHKCSKKVKKVLCKFLEIQDQVYDEKNNKVTIKVFSSCPERIRDKLCCEGQGCIKSIEIPPPPTPTEKPPPQPPPKELLLVPVPVPVLVRTCCNECYKPCYGHGAPISCCDGYCGRQVCDSWGGGCGCSCGCGGGYYGCGCRGYY